MENCDNNDAIFMKGLLSRAAGDSYLDDIAMFGSPKLTTLWRGSFTSGDESWLYNTNVGNVGVGTEEPQTELHVVGDIRAENSVQADEFCDSNDLDCFTPNGLGSLDGMIAKTVGTPDPLPSDPPQYGCPAGQAAIGIEKNMLICQPIFSGPISFDCPDAVDGSKQFVSGFTSSGVVTCAVPPP